MKSLTAAGSIILLLSAMTGACFEDVPVGADTDAGSGSDGGTGGKACTSDSDCSANEICGFPTAEACAAKGECFASPGAECEAYSPGCACDGTEINIACNGLPSGYETKPLAHDGTCSADAGNPPSEGGGAACSTSADCAANEICGFPEAEACSATGQCYASPGVVCEAYSPGCACDGTEINVACNGLPTGYETKPIAHTGECASTSADAGPG
jgi:hypothetical protein